MGATTYIERDIISFDLAKQASKKGAYPHLFDHQGHYNETTKSGAVTTHSIYPKIPPSLLQKWLRDIHNIDVWAQPFVHKQSLPDESYSYFLYKDGVYIDDGTDFLNFEEALEEGLKEALKLI